jgi:hypothetical protein
VTPVLPLAAGADLEFDPALPAQIIDAVLVFAIDSSKVDLTGDVDDPPGTPSSKVTSMPGCRTRKWSRKPMPRSGPMVHIRPGFRAAFSSVRKLLVVLLTASV